MSCGDTVVRLSVPIGHEWHEQDGRWDLMPVHRHRRVQGASQGDPGPVNHGASPGDLTLGGHGDRNEELLAMIVARDVCGLEALATRFDSLIHAVAYRILGDRDTADDVAQEALLKIGQSASHYDCRRGSVQTWILAVARYAAIDAQRRIALRARHETPYLETSCSSPHATVWDSVARNLERDWLSQALATLPSEQRHVIALAYLGGFTHAQIATRLGLPLGTVKARIRYGMIKLRTTLPYAAVTAR